ncbi:uncharacterized protein EI90DRAFT_3153571 [Cantharellus anzutake]|uniref:uncharacterized protein n=1 Tax=Cantharellus anzutake TaxID=1750568 RepID=UPI0019039BA9|nr:uncharacterized protein EI90DRAFT_3153571 [Cantharellus anzutake]KAF8334257.1 hypothetical protein EI90DRAFT_3153571 [Cantharellus anzutake]
MQEKAHENAQSTAKIVTGTGTATAVGFISGGVYGLSVRGINPILTAASMGLNFGIVGLGFFCVREWLVSPILVSTLGWEEYARRGHSTTSGHLSPPPSPSLRKMRTEGLLDTALAGACTGAALNSMRRGIRGLIPGAVTVSLAFSGVQYVTNSLHIARLQYLAVKKDETANAVASSPDEIRQSALSTPATPPSPAPTLTQSVLDKLRSFSPVKRLTPEEFDALKERRTQDKAEKEGSRPVKPER